MKMLGQSFLFFLFFVLIIEVIVIAPKEANNTTGPASPSAKDSAGPKDWSSTEKAQQSIKGLHLIETRNEEKEWELWSDSATTMSEKDSWRLEKVKAIFFGKDGVFFRVTGNGGNVDVRTKNMNVEGAVIIQSSNGYIFKTEAVAYYSASQSLESPGAVEVFGPPERGLKPLHLVGDKMMAYLEKSSMELIGNVKGEKTFEKGRRALIRSQKAEFSGKSKYANFTGNVIIDLDSMRVTGPMARFKYSPKTKQIESLVVEGGVKMTDVDKWATSKQVEVFVPEEKYVFKGNPRVVQNSDELIGDEITLLDGGKRVKVHRARARVDKGSLERKNE